MDSSFDARMRVMQAIDEARQAVDEARRLHDAQAQVRKTAEEAARHAREALRVARRTYEHALNGEAIAAIVEYVGELVRDGKLRHFEGTDAAAEAKDGQYDNHHDTPTLPANLSASLKPWWLRGSPPTICAPPHAAATYRVTVRPYLDPPSWTVKIIAMGGDPLQSIETTLPTYMGGV